MNNKHKVITVVFKKRSNKVKCKFEVVDSELFLYGYYLLKGRINILGASKRSSQIMISSRIIAVTMLEKDWKLLDKAKPLINKTVQMYLKTRGLNFFQDTDKTINLI